MRRLIGAAVLVAAVALLLYLPTLSFEFLNWDDPEYVLRNPWIRGWSSENLARIFTKPYAANFLPLHLVSYMVDYSLWDLRPFGYHLQSILLHAANTVLVLLLVYRMFGRALPAFLAALFFAVHPSHVEAVAWISIRKDLLATFFALIGLGCYLRATPASSGATGPVRLRRGWYAASVIAFGLGLLSKVTIVVLPAFLLLLDRVRPGGAPGRPWRLDLASKAPYALLGAALVVVNALAQAKAQAAYAHDPLSYAIVKGSAAWTYVALLFGIVRGSPNYDTPALGHDPLTVLVCLAGLVVLPAGAWLAARLRSRAVFLGLSWVVLFLLPPLAFPLVTYMADRYLYLPSVGFCWALAELIARLARNPALGRWRSAAAAGLATAIVAVFLARSVQALPVWRDSEALWRYALTRSQDFRAYTNLAEVLLERGKLDEAEQLLRVSARVENPWTYQNLGVLYFERGRYPEAAAALERALLILRRRGWDPEHASTLYYSLGAAYLRMGDVERTRRALEAAVRENPRNQEARERLEQLRASTR